MFYCAQIIYFECNKHKSTCLNNIIIVLCLKTAYEWDFEFCCPFWWPSWTSSWIFKIAQGWGVHITPIILCTPSRAYMNNQQRKNFYREHKVGSTPCQTNSTVYVTVRSLCQTFHKNIQRESRFINKVVMGVEYKFWHHCLFIHKTMSNGRI